jgi:hypothetical protein
MENAVGVPNVMDTLGNCRGPDLTDNLVKADWAHILEFTASRNLGSKLDYLVLDPSGGISVFPYDVHVLVSKSTDLGALSSHFSYSSVAFRKIAQAGGGGHVGGEL